MSTLSKALTDHDTTKKQGFFIPIRAGFITGIQHLYIKKNLLNRTDYTVYMEIKMINYQAERTKCKETKISNRYLAQRMGFKTPTPIKQSIKRLIKAGLILPSVQKERCAASYKINEDKEKEIAEMAMNDPDLRAYVEFT